MKYGALFSLLGILCAAYAFRIRGPAYLLLWLGLSFMVVAFGYLGFGPAVFGKRPDGTIALWSRVLLLPYLPYLWGTWRLLRAFQREDPFNDLAPGIVIGRRLLPSECLSSFDGILDLTCEFPEPPAIRTTRDYWCFGILDGSVPKERDLVELIRQVRDYKGTVYIHCAQGHGRTAMVSACLLVAKGLAPDSGAALAMIRASRPAARLKRPQRLLVETVAPMLIQCE